MRAVFVHIGRENLGIEYLSSVLKNHGFDTMLAYDPGLFSQEDNVLYSSFLANIFSRKNILLEKVQKHRPDIIAFSAYSSNYRLILNLAKEIRAIINVPIVFGGMHATLVPEEVIRHDFIDFLIMGEGEYPLLELLISLRDDKPLCNIKNLWYKTNGRIIKNDLRPPVSDLDSLPFPDKDLFKKEVRHVDDYIIMASRGCLYSCSYCCESYLNRIYKGKYFRKRSIGSVINELKVMKEKYSFKRVMFFDSIFFSDENWIRGFLPEYTREISVPFRCTGHVNFASYEMIRSLKDAGCYCVDFGVQTFNENIRKKILDRFETNEQIKKALAACDKVKLRYDIDLMFGIPYVTEEDYRSALKFINVPNYLNRLKCYYLSYYPKLSIIDKARKANVLKDSDIDDITKGKTGDWFHMDSIKDAKHKKLKDNFEKLYKIYPIIPFFLLPLVLRYRFYRFLHLIPNMIVIFIQLIIGIAKKDYRFRIYINNYAYQLKGIISLKK